MIRRMTGCLVVGVCLWAIGCSGDSASPAGSAGSGAAGQAGAGGAAGQGGGQGGSGNASGNGGSGNAAGAGGSGNAAGEAGAGGVSPDGGVYWPGDFEGGCFDINAATINDTCLSEAATIPNNPPASLLDRINKRRTAVGKPALSNPVNLSLEFETSLQALLVDKYPPFPLDPIDPTDLADGTIQVQVPNVYGVHPDQNGNVPQDDMITLTCQVAGNVGTCAVDNMQLDITDIMLDAIAGGDVDTPAALSCIVTLGGTVTVTWVSSEEVRYGFAYQLDVVETECNDTIEAFFKQGACSQSYDLTAHLLGPVAQSGPPCAAYVP